MTPNGALDATGKGSAGDTGARTGADLLPNVLSLGRVAVSTVRGAVRPGVAKVFFPFLLTGLFADKWETDRPTVSVTGVDARCISTEPVDRIA